MLKLIGKKMGMTSIFDEDGNMIPVTVLQMGPCPVTQIKTVERDGYSAVQIAYADGMKKNNVSKPVAGHLEKSGVEAMRVFEEIRTDDVESYELGKELTVEIIDEGVSVSVVGTSKGRGFTGGMKRYGFAGHRASHGEEKHHRTNGSLSSAARLTHVWKGKRMSGHMGVDRKTIKNLDVVKVDKEKNIIVVKGSVPGHSGALVTVVQ
ncbi:MAG: 50S ribosomal protein L3 [Planctomycetes bacterium]|nr:50S ribosomal protein L3 [Planctomycetota bacterium]